MISLVMINEKYAKSYCSEDISLIENYHQAIADEEKMWDIHHRRECDSEGRTLFTKKQLIEMNLYVKRPASELVFVTRSMHKKLHREMLENIGKNVGKKYGKICGKKYGKINGKKYGKIGGKIGGKKTGAINGKKCSIPILQFTKDGELVKEWLSAHEAGRQLGISQSHICQCCKGRKKSAGGFVWRYAPGRR